MKRILGSFLNRIFPHRTNQGATPVVASSPPDPERFKYYTGFWFDGNYIWSGAMNLCWTELCQSVIKAPLILRTDEKEALHTANCLNHPVCTKADLDEPSYYVKSGLGPPTLAAINRESRARFPQKRFPDLQVTLGDEDIISYAYFYKAVSYETPFTTGTVFFKEQKVAGFEAHGVQKQSVESLYYENDACFVVRLRLKDPADTLLLAKGFDTGHPEAVLRLLEGLDMGDAAALGENDYFQMPSLKLSCRRDYPEIIGKNLGNQGFENCTIGEMFENIDFELDQSGARVESQAVISVVRGAMISPVKKRYFYLNEPFWVLMKRTDSPNPYFLLGVHNTEIMQTL